MSKGHGCMIQYVILEELGILRARTSTPTARPTGSLGAHPDYGNPGIEASTGSLGHGLSMAVGMALRRARRASTDGVIYTVLSDGEVQEGSTWEAMMMASSLEARQPRRLHRQQRLPEPRAHVARRIRRSIRWPTSSRPSAGRRSRSTATTRRPSSTPSTSRSGEQAAAWCVAKTTKGKGVSYMENVPIWHYRSPNKDEYEQALRELEEAAS